jgi:hypothetical protein
MQISRHLLVTCTVAACLIPTFVHAADNEAQIRARQALEEKMNQIGTQPAPAAAPANPAPKPMATKPAAPVVTVTPNSTTVESQPAPRVAMPSNDAATNQKLQEALRQKMQQTPAEPPAPVVTTQKPAKPAPTPAKPAPTKAASAKPAPVPASSANYAPLPGDNATTTRPSLPTAPTPMPAPYMGQNQQGQPNMSLPPLEGPSTGFSPAKQRKLDDLLEQYRLDQITSQQYQEQRAKIRAEP